MAEFFDLTFTPGASDELFVKDGHLCGRNFSVPIGDPEAPDALHFYLVSGVGNGDGIYAACSEGGAVRAKIKHENPAASFAQRAAVTDPLIPDGYPTVPVEDLHYAHSGRRDEAAQRLGFPNWDGFLRSRAKAGPLACRILATIALWRVEA